MPQMAQIKNMFDSTGFAKVAEFKKCQTKQIFPSKIDTERKSYEF